ETRPVRHPLHIETVAISLPHYSTLMATAAYDYCQPRSRRRPPSQGSPSTDAIRSGWTSERHPSHEPEPGSLEVTVEGKRDRNFESPHDGEADAVREAQAGVIQALVHVEGRLLHGLVRADDVDDAAGQEQAREANGPRRTQPD